MRPLLTVLLFATLVRTTSACAHVDHRIDNAALCFDDARYDDALVWLADLDDDVGRMALDDEAYFYYLRGMTAFRLDRRTEALHYLALSREMIGAHSLTPHGLDVEVLRRTLEELVPTTATWNARAGASTTAVTTN